MIDIVARIEGARNTDSFDEVVAKEIKAMIKKVCFEKGRGIAHYTTFNGIYVPGADTSNWLARFMMSIRHPPEAELFSLTHREYGNGHDEADLQAPGLKLSIDKRQALVMREQDGFSQSRPEMEDLITLLHKLDNLLPDRSF